MARNIAKMFETKPIQTKVKQGSTGFDNSRENIDPNIKTKNITAQTLTLAASITLSSDGTNVYLKNGATTILTINLTTGNITLGGTQKYITCSKIVGA
jgi:hypothetical protein